MEPETGEPTVCEVFGPQQMMSSNTLQSEPQPVLWVCGNISWEQVSPGVAEGSANLSELFHLLSIFSNQRRSGRSLFLVLRRRRRSSSCSITCRTQREQQQTQTLLTNQVAGKRSNTWLHENKLTDQRLQKKIICTFNPPVKTVPLTGGAVPPFLFSSFWLRRNRKLSGLWLVVRQEDTEVGYEGDWLAARKTKSQSE